VTVYGHLSKVFVKKHQWVKTSELIGRMGTTGRSTGSHLHFEVHKNGRLVNPLKVTVF
ncbi:MAG TPA: M23 family metallopeptidase, partial [Spirochaetota bacterium]|nr:M23 family metallopeptidase [Spirochaetota bacterium]